MGRKSSSKTLTIETVNLTKVYPKDWSVMDLLRLIMLRVRRSNRLRGEGKYVWDGVVALKGLNLEVAPGEIFGLLGPNGSGKTTTIKLLLGLLFPTRGEAKIFGKPASDIEVKARVGYLPEESYLYRFLNADETLDFYGQLFRIPRRERRRRADELIERVGLKHARKRKLQEYSKGMARRIGLAQALINRPELVILDEPTSGLDPLGIRDVKDLVLSLKENGLTVLLCSHLMAHVEDLCDRIAILDYGELIRYGSVRELLAETEILQFRTSGLSAKATRKISQAIGEAGGEVLGVENASRTLEDLFLETIRERKRHESDHNDR